MSTLKKLNYLFDKKTKIEIIGIFLVILLGSVLELLGVGIVLPVVDLAISPDVSGDKLFLLASRLTGHNERKDVLLFLILATIFIYAFKSVYLAWMNAFLFKFSAKVKRELATRLMKSYLVQPYAFFLKKDTATLIRSINSDTASLYEVITNILLIMSNGVTVIALVVGIIVISPVMALLVTALLGFCAVIILLVVQKRTRRYGRENQKASSDLIKYLQQSFEGIKEIKIIGSEKYFINQYDKTYKKQTDIGYKSKLVNILPKYMIEGVCIIGIMGYFGWNVKFNPDYLQIVSQLAAFVTAAYKLLPSVNAVYAYVNTVVYHRASIDLVYNDIKEANELQIKEGAIVEEIEPLEFNKEIIFDNVSFNYDNSEKKVLNGVALSIPKGKSVALVGPSGGGKTTTADLLIGLLRTTSGKILVDGTDVMDNLEGWRKQIGYIPQSIYLTDDSIKANVALGEAEKDIDEEKVRKALAEAQLLEFVDTLEDGIETKVGERGARLSGGQRQRIGIARALYRNPAVLVFDEATSALDNETEKEVMKAIDGLHGNKTMIMIAHRLSTIENCDIVYHIEDGKVTRER